MMAARLPVALSMLRSANLISRTRPEAARLTRITAIEPRVIHATEDLEASARRCRMHDRERSDDTRFPHGLVDREIARLQPVAASPAGPD